jgi:hypothetical protein
MPEFSRDESLRVIALEQAVIANGIELMGVADLAEVLYQFLTGTTYKVEAAAEIVYYSPVEPRKESLVQAYRVHPSGVVEFRSENGDWMESVSFRDPEALAESGKWVRS